MAKLSGYFYKQPKLFFILSGILLVLLISVIDYLTKDFFVLEFYIIPPAITVWFAGRKAAVFMAFLSAIAALALDIIESPVHSTFWVHYWNIVMNFGFFTVIVYLLWLLKKTLADLKKLTEIKDSLTHMIIHDLNNPLAVISGELYILNSVLKNRITDEEKKDIETAAVSCQDLQGMIGNLLDINKLEESKIKLNCESFALEDTVKLIVERIKARASADEKILSLEVLDNLPDILADKDIISRIIDNLINNALKFTPPKGTVSLKIFFKPEDKNIYIKVTDTGKGIPKEYLEKIFDKFFQVETPEATRGHGLGLTFCRMMVEAHGGKIWAESEGLGKGATITFTIPVRR